MSGPLDHPIPISFLTIAHALHEDARTIWNSLDRTNTSESNPLEIYKQHILSISTYLEPDLPNAVFYSMLGLCSFLQLTTTPDSSCGYPYKIVVNNTYDTLYLWVRYEDRTSCAISLPFNPAKAIEMLVNFFETPPASPPQATSAAHAYLQKVLDHLNCKETLTLIEEKRKQLILQQLQTSRPNPEEQKKKAEFLLEKLFQDLFKQPAILRDSPFPIRASQSLIVAAIRLLELIPPRSVLHSQLFCSLAAFFPERLWERGMITEQLLTNFFELPLSLLACETDQTRLILHHNLTKAYSQTPFFGERTIPYLDEIFSDQQPTKEKLATKIIHFICNLQAPHFIPIAKTIFHRWAGNPSAACDVLCEATTWMDPVFSLRLLYRVSKGNWHDSQRLFSLALKLIPPCLALPDGGTSLVTLAQLIPKFLSKDLILSADEKRNLFRLPQALLQQGLRIEALDLLEEYFASSLLPATPVHLLHLEPYSENEAIADFLIRYCDQTIEAENEMEAQFLLRLFNSFASSTFPHRIGIARDLVNKLPIRRYPAIFKDPLRSFKKAIDSENRLAKKSDHEHEIHALQRYFEEKPDPLTLAEVIPSFLRRLRSHQPKEKILFLDLFKKLLVCLSSLPNYNEKAKLHAQLVTAVRKHPFLFSYNKLREHLLKLHLADIRHHNEIAKKQTPHLISLLKKAEQLSYKESYYCIELLKYSAIKKEDILLIHPALIRCWTKEKKWNLLPIYLAKICSEKIYLPLDEPFLSLIIDFLSHEALTVNHLATCTEFFKSSLRGEERNSKMQTVMGSLFLGALKLQEETIAKTWLEKISKQPYEELWTAMFCHNLLSYLNSSCSFKLEILQAVQWSLPAKLLLSFSLSGDEIKAAITVLNKANQRSKISFLTCYSSCLSQDPLCKEMALTIVSEPEKETDLMDLFFLLTTYQIHDAVLWQTILKQAVDSKKKETIEKACKTFLDLQPSALSVDLDCWTILLAELPAYPLTLLIRIFKNSSFKEALASHSPILKQRLLASVLAKKLTTMLLEKWIESKQTVLAPLPKTISAPVDALLFIPFLDRSLARLNNEACLKEACRILSQLIGQGAPSFYIDTYLHAIVSSLSLKTKENHLVLNETILQLIRKYCLKPRMDIDYYRLAFCLIKHSQTIECSLEAGHILHLALQRTPCLEQSLQKEKIGPTLDLLTDINDQPLEKKVQEAITLIQSNRLMEEREILKYQVKLLNRRFSDLASKVKSSKDHSFNALSIQEFITYCARVVQLSCNEHKQMVDQVLNLCIHSFAPLSENSFSFNEILKGCFEWAGSSTDRDYHVQIREVILQWIQKQKPSDFSLDTAHIIASEMKRWTQRKTHHALLRDAIKEMIFFFPPHPDRLKEETTVLRPLLEFAIKKEVFCEHQDIAKALQFYLSDSFDLDIPLRELKESLTIAIFRLTAKHAPFASCQYARRILNECRRNYPALGSNMFAWMDKIILYKVDKLLEEASKGKRVEIFSFYCDHLFNDTIAVDLFTHDSACLDLVSHHITKDPLFEKLINKPLALRIIHFYAGLYEGVTQLPDIKNEIIINWQGVCLHYTTHCVLALQKTFIPKKSILKIFEELGQDESISEDFIIKGKKFLKQKNH